MSSSDEAYNEDSKCHEIPTNTESQFPPGSFRFPGPGLKRSQPGSESKSNKPPEPIISQIIDKLKHINQVSSLHAMSMFSFLFFCSFSVLVLLC